MNSDNQCTERAASAPQPKSYIGDVGGVRASARFDENRLDEYLCAMVPGYRGPLTVKQFEGGQSNPTYLLITPNEKYVLRRKPMGVLLASAHAVDREFRVISALSEVGFPVPETLVLCTDDEVIGSMFYVMRHVAGRIFWNCRMPDLSPPERAAVYDSVNATLARLHTIDYQAIGLGDYGRPGNYFSRQIARWSKQYELSKTEDIPELDKLMDWLPGATPAGDDGLACIAHGDYSFHNVMIHPTEPRVVAVVDWELSTIGHPLGDLMYHAMEWYRPPGVDARGTLKGANLAELGIPTLDEYLQRYCERTGFKVEGNLDFYRAFNLFRVAAILQGIARRAIDGNAAAANATEIAALIRPLAKAAWAYAREGGAV